jgi:UDP-glucuronate 4-epimerase
MEKIELENKSIFVTGSAGFIGSNLVKRLFKDLKRATIVGIDNMNHYYDVEIKKFRLKELNELKPEGITYHFIEGDIADKTTVDKIFAEYKPSVVVNLAAQAGVRYSITNPDAYIQSNLIGFYNILEACRHSYDDMPSAVSKSMPTAVSKAVSNGKDDITYHLHDGSAGVSSYLRDGKAGAYKGVEHLVYASSSSVYGSNKKVPYSTDDKVDNPVSLYAATKKSNELMAHAYSKLYNIPSTGLRFFTVYGPAGRPDMAYFGFTNKLVKGETIKIFNYGKCKRDFTFVDDIVEGVVRIMKGAPERRNGEDGLPLPPYNVYNIGNNSPENLLDFVDILQQELIRAGILPQDYDFEAHKELVPMQPGDVPVTYADTTPLERDYGFKPATPCAMGSVHSQSGIRDSMNNAHNSINGVANPYY